MLVARDSVAETETDVIPTASTTITVKEPRIGGDPYEDATARTVASKIRAHFSAPSGRERVVGGQQTRTDMVLDCDPCALTNASVVLDELSAERWQVAWVERRRGLGLDHLVAGVNRVTGASSG